MLWQLVKIQVEFGSGDFDGLGKMRERGLEGIWSQWQAWGGSLVKERGWEKHTANDSAAGGRGLKRLSGRWWARDSPPSKPCLTRRVREGASVPWQTCVGSWNPRHTANRRHRHWISLVYFACICCASAHFIRSSACHLLWKVHLPFTGERRITMFQDRRTEPLGNFVVNEWGLSVAVMRRLTKRETIISGKLCFAWNPKQEVFWENRFFFVYIRRLL